MSVLKVNEPEQLVSGRTKQDIKVADATTVTLWGNDIAILQLHKCYQLNRLEIRSYLGKTYPSGPSFDIISDIEDTVEHATSPEDNEDEFLEDVTVTGIKQL